MVDFDEYKRLLEADRSFRRFDGTRLIGQDVLEKLVELTRFCASGRNLQPLRYRVVTSERERAALFGALKWAGYYADWDGPEEGERPTAYLVQCLDTTLAANCLCDDGLQLQAITLGATTLGLRGCIIKAFNVQEVISSLQLPDRYHPRYVLALGYPAEKVTIVDTDGSTDADIRYYRDSEGRHYVPKRPLDELLID